MSGSVYLGVARRRAGASKHGFTLVELLVVVGIIAILVAVLMPALSRARDQANGVKCSANMHTMMMSALMFAQDHQGHLPGNWFDMANPDEEKRDFLMGNTGKWTEAPKAGTLWRYIKDENVYRCPSRSMEGGRTMGSSYTNGHFDYSVCLMLTGARVSNIRPTSVYCYADRNMENSTAAAIRSAPLGTTILPTPVFVEETAFRGNLNNIEGGWSNVDEHSDHHRGGSYYASIDGSVHWFNGRKKPNKSQVWGSSGYQYAEAWQWATVSPTRGEIPMAYYSGVNWGWFDRSR